MNLPNHYLYNANNQRTAKLLNDQIEEKYLWLNKTTLLAIYDKDDNLITRFYYSGDRVPYKVKHLNQIYYLSYNHIGSLKQITDTKGQTVKSIIYSAYGNIIEDTNPNLNIPIAFAGGLYDKDTKLIKFGYREYDSQIGRWITKDPIDFSGGDSNLYGYVLNDPINFVDPWGLDYSIYVNEGGERNGTTYGASIVIYSSRQGRVLTNINGSSWPNPNSGAPGIAPGYYESRYSPIGHQQRTNGVRLLNGGFVPTIGANPAQGGQSVANGVNIHCGYRDNWRGSQNCITIHPDHCERVWDFLGNDNGDTGNVILYR